MHNDPETIVRDHAVLAIAALEPGKFRSIAEGIDVVGTVRRLNGYPEAHAYLTPLTNQIADGMALADWLETDPPGKFLTLTLEKLLGQLAWRSEPGSPLDQRYESCIISKWLRENGFAEGATWETAVTAVAEGRSDFAKIAHWFAGYGLQRLIDQLLNDALAKAGPDQAAAIQQSYVDLMNRLNQMMR